MSYADMDINEAKEFKPTVLFVDENNKIIRKSNYEKYGKLSDQ